MDLITLLLPPVGLPGQLFASDFPPLPAWYSNCLAFGVAAGFFANRVPSSFLPDEDQGYAFVNLQLPNGASLERTTGAAADVEKILMSTPGVQYITSIVGFSLLSLVRTSYNAFFFVTLRPWGERTTRAEQFQAIKAHLNQELSRLPAGTAFSFSPPAIANAVYHATGKRIRNLPITVEDLL